MRHGFFYVLHIMKITRHNAKVRLVGNSVSSSKTMSLFLAVVFLYCSGCSDGATLLDSGVKVSYMSDAVGSNVNIEKNLNNWDESATWRQSNSVLNLLWMNAGGDWVDANGEEQGSQPFVAVDIVDDDKPGVVEIDVLSVIDKTNAADFFIRRKGGQNYVFKSREAGEGGPTLTLNGDTILRPVADTFLNNSTVRALGDSEILATNGPILIRFNLPDGLEITQASLKLESTGAEYGDQTLQVYTTNSSLRTIVRPLWLKIDPTIIAVFNGNDVLNKNFPVTAKNGIATSQLSSPNLTWINSIKTIPNQTEACATVYQKLGVDFQPGEGGKFPGFSNTGLSLSGSDVVNGVTYPNSGWGGRRPDGVHWSARTGYGRWSQSHVSSHTYFYAMEPNNGYGWVDPVGYPFLKGKWIAYVQCMKLNTTDGTIGNKDGKLYYEIAGADSVYSREDIRWRDLDAPETEIREFWVNYYCGGTSCGNIANRGTVSFSKVVITKGLPDMDAVKAEVDRLNQ